MNAGRTAARRADYGALAVAAVLAALAGLIAWDAYQLALVQSYARVGPKAFPYAIAAGLLGLAALTAVTALRGITAAREPQAVSPVLWIVAGLALQALLVGVAGFSIATGLLFACTAYAFGRTQLAVTLPAGILLSLALWLLFAKGLSLTLPVGPLERLF